MSYVVNDLDIRSTISTISSVFTELEEDGGDENCHESPESPEMKFVPPEVKAEISDEIGNVTEDDIDDDFIDRYLGGGEEESSNTERLAVKTQKSAGPLPSHSENREEISVTDTRPEEHGEAVSGDEKRESRRRTTLWVKQENIFDDPAEDADDNYDEKDDEWTPANEMDDDWWPGKKLLSGQRSTSRKQITKKRGRPPGKRAYKRRAKVESDADIKFEVQESDTVMKKGRRGRKKKILTPEEAEEARLKKLENAEKRKLLKEEIKNETAGESDTSDMSRSKSTKSRKKRISEMTPEEAAKERARWATRKRKRISEMTPEEAEKERERWRVKRQQEREKQKLLLEAIKNEQGVESDASSLMSTITIGRRKKRISEMTPEERQAAQERWKREHERRKERRAQMPLEKREAEKARARERQRVRRALAKEGALPQDQLLSMEEQYRKDRERKRARRAAMTPEQKREEMQKNSMYRIARMAKMTEDEKKARQIHNYMQRMARLASMTEEERERERQKRREKGVRRYYKLKETLGQEGIREMRRNYWHSMTPERKEKALAKLRECHKRRVERLKEEGRWDEIKKVWYERDKTYKQRRKENDGCVRRRRRRRVGDGQIGADRSSGGSSKHKTWAEMTEEEKERKREQRRLYTLKKKLAIQKLLDSGMTMEEIQQQTETPEQRERRLIRQRIRKAKGNLRRRLESTGAPPEEIEKKVEELKHTYQPTYAFRPYKPRPENFKRIDPTVIPDLETLGELEIKHKVTKTPLLPSETPVRRRRRTTIKEEPTDPSPPRKRGRPLKYPPLQQHQQEQPLQPPQVPPPPPQPVASASSSVIVSVKDIVIGPPAMTTILTLQPPQQLQPQPIPSQPSSQPVTPTPTVHPQQQYTQYEATFFPNSTHAVLSYPHQQPQLIPQSYSLHQILDSIPYHETGVAGASGSVIIAQPANYHYDNSTTSSQHEYGSSYYDDDNQSHPPISPHTGGYEDYSEFTYTPSQPQPPVPSPQLPPLPIHGTSVEISTTDLPADTTVKKEEETPKKPKKPRGPRPYVYRPPKNPNAKTRTKRADVIRDVVCDECGQPYNRLSLRAHKNQLHNPNYDLKNRTCRICGEKYKHAQRWYTHYLRDHVRPNEVKPNKTHICEECGQSFVNKENYRKHQYYMHGDGLKRENHIRCPVCPEEKLFKEKMGYHSHLQRFHPDYVRPGHDCYRCDKSFPNEKVLAEHVRVNHPDSYFACSYCTACRFTQLGLYFHYSRCTKITREERVKLKSKCNGIFSLEWVPIPCELCGKAVMLSSLTRHYREMHNVTEDKFTCPVCQKVFKVRGFWANHLEEKHLMPLEDLKKLASKLNAVNQEGMSVQPLKSRYKGGWRPRNSGSGGGPKTKRKIRNSDDDEESGEEDDSESENSEIEKDINKKKKKTIVGRKRRKIVVIAEEDEHGDENLEGMDIVQTTLFHMKKSLSYL